MSHHDNHDSNHEHGGHHIVPLKMYILIWAALIVGTVITVAVSYVDFGSLNMFIAMLIATVKASLVMLIFMGLKYDSPENSITFLLSFVFLGIFVSFTAVDIFWRVHYQPAVVDKSLLAASTGPIDLKKLTTSSPEVVAKGQVLFAQNCVTCHGVEGKGDGAAAATLNPKPRDFTQTSGWKNGRKVTEIFTTLTKGIKDSAMAAYEGLSIQERFALAHYVQSLGPKSDSNSETSASLATVGLSGSEKIKPELTPEDGMARYVTDKAVREVPAGNIPRSEYCKVPAQYRPKWCQVNTTEPVAE